LNVLRFQSRRPRVHDRPADLSRDGLQLASGLAASTKRREPGITPDRSRSRERLLPDLERGRLTAPPAAALLTVSGTMAGGPPRTCRARCGKVRAVLRQLIERFICLFTGRRIIRFAAVRVDFRPGLAPQLPAVLSSKRGGTNARVQQPGTMNVLGIPDVPVPSGLDLREPAAAAAIEDSLATIDSTSLGW
jgi:hypothetical protein